MRTVVTIPKRPSVLIACEFSAVVRDSFRALGYNAWSCDLIPSEGDSTFHWVGDVRDYLDYGFDLLIAHPPCTYLTNAGVRWLYKNGRGTERDSERWGNMEEGACFFRQLLDAPIPRICIENPVMHSYGRALVATIPSQTIHPWQYGHCETKATQLYLKNLPLLRPTNIIKADLKKYPAGRGNGFEPRVHHASPGPDRWKERSRTMAGIGAAMAAQWGPLL